MCQGGVSGNAQPERVRAQPEVPAHATNLCNVKKTKINIHIRVRSLLVWVCVRIYIQITFLYFILLVSTTNRAVAVTQGFRQYSPLWAKGRFEILFSLITKVACQPLSLSLFFGAMSRRFLC